MRDRVISGKPKLLKDINRNLLIKLIIRHGKIGRSELAKLSNLSLPSVMRITDALIEEGLVVEVGKGLSSGGRKPSLLTLKSDALYIIGVEIALRTTVVLTDLSGRMIEKWESDQAQYTTPENMLLKINEQIGCLIRKHHIPYEKLAGIGIGTPGMNFKHMQEMELSILKGWENLDVQSWFESRWKAYSVLIVTENVARTRTLNELWFGLGRVHKSFIYVFVDQGVGCGFVTNDVVFLGYNHVAGEFGHTIIEPSGRPCYCGNKGCIEMYVSAGAIAREVKRALGMNFPGFGFLDVVEIEDHPAVHDILKKNGEILGYGIANLINLFNPKAIVLGGEVPKASSVFSKYVIDTVYDTIFSKNAMQTPIEVSQISRESDCLGSVALVINALFKSIEIH